MAYSLHYLKQLIDEYWNVNDNITNKLITAFGKTLRLFNEKKLTIKILISALNAKIKLQQNRPNY